MDSSILVIFIPVLVAFIGYFFISPRKSLLAGFIFLIFSAALPWHLIPINGLSSMIQLFFGISTLLLAIVDKCRTKIKILNTYTVGLILLGVLLGVYILVSDSQSYGVTKTEVFFLNSIFPVLILFLTSVRPGDFRFLCAVLIFASFWTMFNLYLGNTNIYLERVTIDDLSPITVGRVIGLGIILLIMSFIVDIKFKLSKITSYTLLSLILLIGIVLTGSRGPLLSMFATLGIVFVIVRKMYVWTRITTLATILTLFFSIVSIPDNILTYGSYERIIHYTQELGENSSDQGRLDRSQLAWEGFLQSDGLGVGTGGFSSLYGVDHREYPHNLLLEVAVEQGVFGLGILFCLLISTSVRMVLVLRKSEADIYQKSISSLWLYFFFNALVSGDIASNNLLWIAGAFIWLMPIGKLNESSEIVLKTNRKLLLSTGASLK